MLELTKVQKTLLTVISASIAGKKVNMDFSDIDHFELLAESQQQTVQLLVYDAIQESIPDDKREEWSSIFLKTVYNNVHVQVVQEQLAKLLNTYPYVILKGLAAAYYYPQPDLRVLGDVDFLIDPTHKDEISNILVSEGYRKSHENHICHIVFRKKNAHLEMHFEPAGIPKGEIGDKIRAFLKPAVRCGECVELTNYQPFRMPSSCYHALILLLHMQHHQLSNGLGLRHLCDWACFVNRTITESFWTEFISFLKEIGLFTYAAVMTKTCHLYLETALPEWAAHAQNQVCQSIIEDVFAGGNFGNKDSLRSNSGMMVSNHGKDGTHHSKAYYLYNILHASTLEKHPDVKNKRILWFVFDCGRTVKYIFRMFIRKRDNLFAMVSKADERARIYQELHIFEVKKCE